jgi:ribosomal protein L2
MFICTEFASIYCEHACDKQLNSERSHDVNRQARILTWLKSEGESIEGLTPEALRNGRTVNSFDSAPSMQGLTHQHPRNNQIH